MSLPENTEELKQLVLEYFKESDDLSDELYDEVKKNIKTLEEGDWVADGKMQFRSSVYEICGKYFRIDETSDNTGYWSDGEYYDPEIVEVKPVEVVTTQWREI